MTDSARFLRGGGMNGIGVAVLGDLVLDRYLVGGTSRVSREAPIPVVVCGGETDNLGGAGNVAANLRGLGCQVRLAGALGEDAPAARVRQHLEDLNIDAKVFARTAPTLTKTRLLCGGQQVARFDHETIEPLGAHLAEEAVLWLKALLDEKSVQAVILSDYGSGFCTAKLCAAAIKTARAAGAPVFVDPRGRDWAKYRGATVATPNLSELASVWGSSFENEDAAVAHVGESVRQATGLTWLLATRSAKGMTLVGEGTALHIPARPVEVFDVSGAGDTVIASLAACSAAGFPMGDAVRFSNEAAQIVVTKTGTYPISAGELLRDAPQGAERVVSREEAADICARWKKEGKRVVFTNGCFDILHAGHADSLERARQLGDRLIVGLNSDRSVRALKGATRPIHKQVDRARLLAALRPVDLLVVFDEDTPSALLSVLRPHVLAKGGDYRPEDLPGREYVEEVVILPLIEGLSTTEILKKKTP